MQDNDQKRIAALRKAATDRLAGVDEAKQSNAYVTLRPEDLVWLAEQAAALVPADHEHATKSADLLTGARGAVTGRDDAEVSLRATDLAILCDLCTPPAAAQA
jgi:calcineurin-like phosphoesterase family protein